MSAYLIASLGALFAALGYTGYRIVKNKSQSKRDPSQKSNNQWDNRDKIDRV